MAAKIQNFVHWHEGMLLSPHHFQQSDGYLQQMFSVFGNSSNTFAYGIHEISVDTSALSSGVIRILKVRGIFQDGYYFDYDAVQDQPLEKNLSEYFSAHTTPLKLHLAIARRKIGANELSGDMARYYPDELTNVNDENTGENLINIPILKPKIRLLTEKEVDERYTSFPVFEAEKSVDGGVVGTNFIPPYIVVDEHSKISEICRGLAQAVRGKISYFADRKDNYAGIVTDESMACLRILIQAALPLEAIIKINGLQPFEIYKCLLHSAAHIISVNPTQLIPLLPKYDHTDLWNTFDALQKYIQNILEKMKQKYEIIRFEKEGAVFKVQMKKEWLEVGDEISIGIQKSFSATDDETLRWIAGVQIASESMLGMIKDRRVLGAERCVLERGAYITQPVGMTILAVKIKNAYIKGSEKLCVSNPSQVGAPEEVILYAER
jgi:type VI secretion system protein ImpJ